MLGLFVNNLLPIFLTAGAGYAAARKLNIDARPLAQITFYVFAPCLVFQLILDSELAGAEVLRMVIFMIGSLLALASLTALLGWAMGWPRTLVAAVVLVVLLPNAGNYGLSANLFALGEEGLARASIFFVSSAMVTFTAGVFVASLGRCGLGEALRGLVKVPAIWGVVLALILVQTGMELPAFLERTIRLVAQASIPAFLVVLGMQLQSKRLTGPPGPLAMAVALRLLGGIAIGLVMARLLQLEGLTYQSGVLQVSMPTAVISIVVATEYDLEPAFVTSAVIVATLASPFTLTPLLAYLGV